MSFLQSKTNNRGRYGKAVNYTHSDNMKIESMQCKILEYERIGIEEENCYGEKF